MKLIFASLLVLAGLPLFAAGDLSKPIEALRGVQKEGQGNEAAGKAWQEIVKADATNLPEVLKGMNGANPLAENWLRAAVGVIADDALKAKKMPVEALVMGAGTRAQMAQSFRDGRDKIIELSRPKTN